MHQAHRSTPEHRATTELRATAAHRASAEEIGREAGLRIRAQLDQQREARLQAAARLERAGLVRYSTPAFERAPAPQPATRQAPAKRATDSIESSDGVGDDASDEAEQPTTASTLDFLSPPSTRDLTAAPEETYLTIPHLEMALRGSMESLQRQNARLASDGLSRIETEADLAQRIAHKQLAPLPTSQALSVNPDLAQNHRYCLPWTASFLIDLARAHDAVFHRPLLVSSAVRTVDYQQLLMRINGNAAPAEGDIVSPHLTGAAVDIVKDGMSRQELDWMRSRLVTFEIAGKIDVEEEFQQACFHIVVYKNYLPPSAVRRAMPVSAGAKSAPVKTAPSRSAPDRSDPATQIAAQGQ